MFDELLAAFSLPSILPHIVPLSLAYIFSLPIGWDREREERSAGIRTFPLVAIASCGFIEASESIFRGETEPTARVIEGLITGVGFIGGGAILRQKASVRGTATAASLWATGAIGVSAGLGVYDISLLLSVATFFTLKALTPLKKEPASTESNTKQRCDMESCSDES